MKEKLFKERIAEQFQIFEKKLNGKAASEFHAVRKNAVNNFAQLPFPSTKDEEWKYTNALPILDYQYSFPPIESKTTKKDLKDILFNEENYFTIVFVNGKFVKELSNLPEKDNSLTMSLVKNISGREMEILLSQLNKNFKTENIFTELNTAFMDEALFIHVPTGSVVERPVQIIFYTDAGEEQIITNPRSFIYLEENSQLKLIETYYSKNGSVYLTNAVTEIYGENNSHFEHVKIQRESEKAFHISSLKTELRRDANYKNYNINLGGKIVRNNLYTRFNDVNSETTLNGLYLGNSEQLIDNHTEIDHAVPHCVSHELYKGVLDDKSRGVFNGKIFVRKDAQKTNAFQENKTILLSTDSRIDAKPQLEIFADDVKCTHGATVGQLDKDALFYLKSRGFSEEAARSTLIYAFASDTVHSISIEEVRNSIEHLIAQKLKYED